MYLYLIHGSKNVIGKIIKYFESNINEKLYSQFVMIKLRKGILHIKDSVENNMWIKESKLT